MQAETTQKIRRASLTRSPAAMSAGPLSQPSLRCLLGGLLSMGPSLRFSTLFRPRVDTLQRKRTGQTLSVKRSQTHTWCVTARLWPHRWRHCLLPWLLLMDLQRECGHPRCRSARLCSNPKRDHFKRKPQYRAGLWSLKHAHLLDSVVERKVVRIGSVMACEQSTVQTWSIMLRSFAPFGRLLT
jgi:hypothetical protein